MTKVYLVRYINNKEIHGVFWSPNRRCLFQSVDEMASPFHFEFAKIAPFGGVWTKHPPGKVGKKCPKFTVSSESILDVACVPDTLKWRRFKESDLWFITPDLAI